MRLKIEVHKGTDTLFPWNYETTYGRLTSKPDAALKGPSYTYTSAGRLQTRTWARGQHARFPLFPKVSAALWERMREAKLGFGGGRVTVGSAFEVVVRRRGDGVSPGRACPKRCANFGHEKGSRPGQRLQAVTS